MSGCRGCGKERLFRVFPTHTFPIVLYLSMWLVTANYIVAIYALSDRIIYHLVEAGTQVTGTTGIRSVEAEELGRTLDRVWEVWHMVTCDLPQRTNQMNPCDRACLLCGTAKDQMAKWGSSHCFQFHSQSKRVCAVSVPFCRQSRFLLINSKTTRYFRQPHSHYSLQV